MTLSTALKHLATARVGLSVEAGNLRLKGPREALTASLKREVSEHKAELLALLLEPVEAIRDRLLAMAGHGGSALVDGLSAEDLEQCRLLPPKTLRTYLNALASSSQREAGGIPFGWTCEARCVRCGPVWLHPSVAANLPLRDGIPVALACPWCHCRRRDFPKPTTEAHS